MLLGYGAKVNCKDCNGRTPLHFSSQTGSIPITQLLLQVIYSSNFYFSQVSVCT